MKKKWLAVLTGLACCAVVFTGCTSVESGTVINKRHENAYDSTYIHNVAACPEGGITMMNGYYDPADYDGLTTEEIAAMRKDTERDRHRVGSKSIWTSKTRLRYTPIFIGKSGVVYVGGVKLEAVRYVDNVQNTHGCVVSLHKRVSRVPRMKRPERQHRQNLTGQHVT